MCTIFHTQYSFELKLFFCKFSMNLQNQRFLFAEKNICRRYSTDGFIYENTNFNEQNILEANHVNAFYGVINQKWTERVLI